MKRLFTLCLVLIAIIGILSFTVFRTANNNRVELKNIKFINNIVYLYFPIQNDSIIFFTDTGGGRIIFGDAFDKLNIKSSKIPFIKVQGHKIETTKLAELFAKKGYPTPISKHYVDRGEKPEITSGIDGILGATWFASKCWEFDYVHQKLYIRQNFDWTKISKKNILKLGFQKNLFGKKTTHFSRIPIVVQNDTIQMLFDTGASAFLSDSAKQTFGNFKTVATSFIVARIFDKWHKNHPDWEYINLGDKTGNEPMIKVPKVGIGNNVIGPVWFTRRQNENFDKWMSKWMDKKIEGAIGGSCFKYFSKIILDYNTQQAYFEK